MREEAYQQYVTGLNLFQIGKVALGFEHLHAAVNIMSLLLGKNEDDVNISSVY